MGASGGPALTSEKLPLSLSQLEVWRDQHAWPGSTHLNLGGTAFFEGPLDLPRLRRALSLLVAQNAALRLVLHRDGGQHLLTAYEPDLPVIDFSGHAEPRQAMRLWWQQWMARPFDLFDAPPWRFALLRASDTLHGGTIQFHHLIMDGWGTSQVMKCWSAIYNSLDGNGGDSPATNVADLSYQEFISESHVYSKSAAFERDAAFWRSQLPSLPAPLVQRDAAYKRQDVLPMAHVVTETIPRADYDRLSRYAAGLGITPFNIFLAAIALYFARICEREQVLVGVPSLNRGGRRYRDTMGMFVGVMGINVPVTPDMTAAALVAAVGTVMRRALRHPRYPLSELARDLEVARSGRDGLFDVLLSFERQDYQVSFGAAELVESRQLFSGVARYPLGITVCEFHARQDLELVLEGSAAYFSQPQVAALAGRIWHIVQALVDAPDALFADISILSAREQSHLVDRAQAAVRWHAQPQTYIAAFEDHAARTPDAMCLIWDGGTMDYRSLDGLANQLAHRLVRLGAGRDRIVAVAMGRSPDLVVAMLAIGKAGAAYLPLDPDAPVARLGAVLQDAGAVALLMQAENWERLGPIHADVVVCNWQESPLETTASAAPARPAAGDLAYVLFTSGSTGRPKGVMIEHAVLARRLAWLSSAYGVTAQDRTALATQATFDPSLIELCLPLVHGASIALAPPGRLLPRTLADFVLRQGATIMAFVPSTLTGFLDALVGRNGLRLRVACCGGEVLNPELARRYLTQTNARLFNVYGPTEACIFATAWLCERDHAGSVLPIGTPVDDTSIYVLDRHQQALPDGIAGEVFIGGDGLARGYLNRPELTQASFLDDPFRPGARMYRTGDRGWLDSGGRLHFMGRLDRQVKLRGYRIELGEIEAALLVVEGVAQAAAQLVETDGRKAIHAWIAPATDVDHERVQRALRVRLPDYMLPSAIGMLPALPVSSSGKIDYSALPAIGAVLSVAATAAREPANQREAALLALWETELARKPLSVLDNFFDVGGDSLAAISILAGAERLFGRKIPLYLLTENPTVERLVAALDAQSVEPEVLVPLGPGLASRILYLAASGHGDLMRFQTLANVLAGSCDLRMLQPPVVAPVRRVKELASLYADHIQAQGSAAVFVAGFSIGGIAAMETARELALRGIEVRGLVLIDTVFPKMVWGGSFYWRLFGFVVRTFRLHALSINGRRLGAMINDPGLVGQVAGMRGYRARAIDCPTFLIKTTGLSRWDRMLFGSWKKLLGSGLTVRHVAGLHGSIFAVGQVQALASVLSDIVRGTD